MDMQKRILIVDDEEGIRKLLTRIFVEEGYEPETAENGREALEKASEKFFNLILLDIKLPDIEGVVFAPDSSGIIRDISNRKKMEEEFLKAGKLQSSAILAGGLAHDFNNILSVIKGNISVAEMHAKNDDQM